MTGDPIKSARNIIDQFQQERRSKKQDQNGRHIIAQEDVASICAQLHELFPNGAKIPNDLIWKFDGCYFPELFTLLSGRYSAVRFTHCKFEKGIALVDVSFVGAFEFSDCDLSKVTNEANVLNLERVTVAGDTTFDSSRIYTIKCVDTVFDGKVSIQKTEIEILKGATFKKGVELSDNSRIQEVSDAKFHDSARFLYSGVHPFVISKCHFHGRTTIGHKNTEQPVHGLMLQDCRFYDHALFTQLTLHKEATVQRVKFEKRCEFRACQFKDRTNFVDVIFQVPPFFTAGYSLSSDTHFLRCGFKSTKTTYDLTAYRELRRIARETIRSAVDEGRFFALEQRTLAWLEWKDWARWGHATISTFYRLGSNYGQSIMRPLFGLGMVTVGAWFALCLYSTEPIVSEHGEFLASRPILGLILQNIFSPFTFFSRAAAFTPADVSGAAISIAQSALSLLFFALFVLSVRRRLKKESE